MKVHYKALMAAAHVLHLEAETMRNDARADRLFQVADALLRVANGADIIEFDNTPEEATWNIAADYAINELLKEQGVCVGCGMAEDKCECAQFDTERK